MDEKKYLIYILKNYINDKDIMILHNINYSKLLYLAQIHNVTGIIGVMNKKYGLNFPDKYTNQLNMCIYSSVSLSVIWDKLYFEISNSLMEHKIKSIVVKGPVVKRYYPDPDLRTMGDIDLIIYKDDIPKAIEVMNSMGFECKEGCVDEYKFVRKDLCVELHEDLTSKDFGTGIDYKKEMQSLFNNVKNPDEYMQELTNEYHLIYLLLHIAQHLISSGCGVRQIMDVAVTIKNVEIDYEFLWKELDKLKLTDLAHCIFYLCNRWFDIKCDAYVMNENIYEALSNHIIEGGVFGYAVDRQNNLIIRESLYGSKFKTFKKRVFPDVKEARSKVIWFRNKPVFLLPFAWVYRWIDICKNNPRRVKNYFNSLRSKTDDKISEEYKMLQAIGFYKNDN